MTLPHQEAFKACCARLYGDDLVTMLLGSNLHPGGPTLTRRLAQVACLSPDERVLDVACGPGASALLLAREFDVSVRGIDLSPALVARALAAASAEGLSSLTRFEIGDAECLPASDASVDAVLCECALCTFPDKQAAVAEFARVLRPRGRLLLSDIVVDREGLTPDLRSFAARVACLADALPLDGYLRLIEGAGLRVCTIEHHDEALSRMVGEVDARLELLSRTVLAEGFDIAAARRLTTAARVAVDQGKAGYVLLTAELDEMAT